MKLLIVMMFGIALAQMPGGWSTVDPSQYQNSEGEPIFLAARSRIDEDASKDGFTFSKVVSIQTQVVAGVNTKFTLLYSKGEETRTYEATVFDQPWTQTRKVFGVTLVDDSVETNRVRKHDLREIGKWEPVSDLRRFQEEHISTIQEVQGLIVSRLNLKESLTVKSIEEAKYQFIAGRNYLLKVRMSDDKVYDLIAYDNPWSKRIEIIDPKLAV